MPRATSSRYDYNARAADYNHVGYNEPDTVLIAQLMGSRRAKPAAGSAATPSEMYAIPNRRMTAQVVSLPLVWETPLRTGNLRDPNGPQSTFAAESFIDELAAAAKADPVEFRMKLLTASTDGRHRVQARPVHCGGKGGGGSLWLGCAAFAEEPRGVGRHPDRARLRLRVPRPDRCRGDRRGRGEPPHRPCLGEAAGVRARLRAGRSTRKRCATPSNAPCCIR